MYENERAKAFWDVPVYAESVMVKAYRIDARIVAKERTRVVVIEMSCPWMDNRAIKDAEKTAKYGPLRWELKQQYPGYEVKQFNIIIEVLGGMVRRCRRDSDRPGRAEIKISAEADAESDPVT